MSNGTFFVLRKFLKKNGILLALIFIFGISLGAAPAYATYERFATGDTASIGEFVYEDDFTASTADCTISIYNPSGTAVVTDATMSEAASGWHSYGYAIPSNGTEGIYPATMSCGTALAGTLVKIDKTFSVGATVAATSTIASAVWNSTTRTLSSFGSLVANVWDALTSGLTTADSIGKLLTDNINATISSRASLTNQTAGWTITMSDFSSVQAGETYRAKVEIRNSNSVPTTPFAVPTITLYDPDRNLTVSSVAMTAIGTGIYEYTYSVASGATQGVWETIVSTQVESGKTLTNNDYWIVAGSPAQVIINSVTGTIPTASADITITNEGLAGYEYQYEWCVVSASDNSCGGGDDIYRGTGAKFINPGEDWNTDLTATVPTAGSYYFKLIVYFGTESSGSSRSFTIAEDTGGSSGGGGGGGGGGGSSGGTSGSRVGADFNGDRIVNSVDFSILLAYWKTTAPFANPSVDINRDNVVNSVDFSILLSQWGTAGRAI